MFYHLVLHDIYLTIELEPVFLQSSLSPTCMLQYMCTRSCVDIGCAEQIIRYMLCVSSSTLCPLFVRRTHCDYVHSVHYLYSTHIVILYAVSTICTVHTLWLCTSCSLFVRCTHCDTIQSIHHIHYLYGGHSVRLYAVSTICTVHTVWYTLDTLLFHAVVQTWVLWCERQPSQLSRSSLKPITKHPWNKLEAVVRAKQLKVLLVVSVGDTLIQLSRKLFLLFLKRWADHDALHSSHLDNTMWMFPTHAAYRSLTGLWINWTFQTHTHTHTHICYTWLCVCVQAPSCPLWACFQSYHVNEVIDKTLHVLVWITWFPFLNVIGYDIMSHDNHITLWIRS